MSVPVRVWTLSALLDLTVNAPGGTQQHRLVGVRETQPAPFPDRLVVEAAPVAELCKWIIGEACKYTMSEDAERDAHALLAALRSQERADGE